MPGKQTAPASKPTSARTTARGAAQPAPKAATTRTGERDENYDLISVLYHALQGAETISQYMEDARESNDEELLSFFEETREAYIERAAEAKQLLASRLEGSEDEEDEDEEDEDEEEDEEDEED
jgi:hypothetical protein